MDVIQLWPVQAWQVRMSLAWSGHCQPGVIAMPERELPEIDLAAECLIRVDLKGDLLLQQTMNTFYFLGGTSTSSVGATQLGAFGAAFETLLVPALANVVSEQTAFVKLTMHNMGRPELAPVDFVLGGGVPVPGLRAGEALPPTNSLRFNRKTGVQGRRGRGGIRLPGVSEDDQASGVITDGALVAAMTGLTTSELMDPVVVTIGLGSVSFYPAMGYAIEGDPPVVRAALVFSWTTTDVITTQNSRKIGHGS